MNSPIAQPIALFLNFEGVLHTPALDDYLEWEFLPQLEAVLREFPNVFVVVTSQDRIGANIVKLREPFSEDIRPRVVGATPNLLQGRAFGGRLLEIEAYLKEIRGSHVRWLALDSEDWLFPKDCPQLVHAHKLTGFSLIAEEELRMKLAALCNPGVEPSQLTALAAPPDTRTLAEKEGALANKPRAPAGSAFSRWLAKFRNR